MSLQRLLVYSPFAALVAVCLAVRVASEQTGRKADANRPMTPVISGLQAPRSLDRSVSSFASISAIPPADVPGFYGPPSPVSGTPAPLKANAPEKPLQTANLATRTYLTSTKFAEHAVARTSEDRLSPQIRLRKPEAWTPPRVYGPPLPPERVQIQKMAHQLRADRRVGRVTLVMEERDGEQLERLERNGIFSWPIPPKNVVVRSERQRNVLAGTTDNDAMLSTNQSRLQLASRGGELERTGPNPADDPDFDPCALPPSPLLMRMLTALAGRSTAAHPLQILSLLRPPYRTDGYIHVGAANPHSMGLAVDIGAYGGYAIRQSNPEACVLATLALLRDLPPGRYRLGMPKAPEGSWDLPPELTALLNRPAQPSAPRSLRPASINSATKASKATEDNLEEAGETTTACAISALYGLYASSAKPTWPFFPPPFKQVVANEVTEDDTTLSSEEAHADKSMRRRKANENSTRVVLRYQNEAYAPEVDLNDTRLRKALEQARKRGVDVVAMFPDGADHIHVDVRQNP